MRPEDRFHQRRARASTALERRQSTRIRNKRYLIVCEGTKTEPQYLKELLEDLNIRPHMVRIARNDGVSPDRVVARALVLYDEDASTGDAFDQVYCVFDRDRHTTFDAAVQRTRDLTAAGKPLRQLLRLPALRSGCYCTFDILIRRFTPWEKSP